jgi:L-lactate dehydrogenase complex protein LldG
MKLYARIARSPRLFALSQKLAALGTRPVSPFGNYVRLPAFTGWGYSKDLSRFAAKPFRERFAGLQEAGIQVNRQLSTTANIQESQINQMPADRKTLVSQFTEELGKVNGNVIRVQQHELTQSVIGFLKARGVDRIHLEPNVLEESGMQQAGIVISHEPDPSIRVGVTKAVCGLADTGSVLIVDGEGHPLQASLLPHTHVAVLCASDILPSLENALTLPIVRESRAAVVVTGPSRTADIEMSLTIGMHGSGEVCIFLVDD